MHEFLADKLDEAAKVPISRRHHWRLFILRALLVTIAIVAIVILGKMLETDLPAIEQWIKDQGAWMPIVFGLIFLLAIILCLPADVFVFLAGTLFGLWWGFLLAALVEYIAMIIEFYLARKLFKNRFESFTSKHSRFRAIDKAISKQGLRIGFLLRLGPVPFSPLSYTLGMSEVSFRNYMLASIGMLPSLLAVVYYGVVAGHLTQLAAGMEHYSWVHYASMIGGAIVMMFATCYIARVARKALKEANAL